jgi:hypothetical protein
MAPISSKYPVAEVIGFVESKSSIWIAQLFRLAVGWDEETIQTYIKSYGFQDRQMDQPMLTSQSHKSLIRPLLAVPHHTTSLAGGY